ncbi:DUF1634 domain-containing protein [Sphingobacterium oryzagri]|uniref:DUF1634 domain-containing protein n=1 Tax=Sphingobacterium oryzagri TaxID=3025669 RepID=A0ABY7WE62_9SPHI|nr:DUF1634 domain-containing protein [Sphingobacterium sp. KACC 22765]WDF67941.1 DUF1634 domain-containing protein [Sphingobacterium sp. KACC 22765]
MKKISEIKDKDVDLLVAYLLRYGVLLASGIALLGGIIYLIQHGQEAIPDYTFFHGEEDGYTTYRGIVEGALTGSAREIIQLGVLALIATPILRVFCSLIAFALERDKMYVLITLIVLSVMLTSIFGGLKV